MARYIATKKSLGRVVNSQDEIESRASWRVLVRAIRNIMPFEEIIRAAPQKEQYLRIGYRPMQEDAP
jgi:hypothetical protein